MREFQVMKQELQEMVHQRLDMSTELSDEAIGDVIDEVIMEKSRNMYMSSVTKLTLRQELFNAIRRLDLLQELIDDKSVSEIMVNGADSIFYERNGKIYTWDRHFESREKLEDVIQQIVSRANRQVNESVCRLIKAASLSPYPCLFSSMTNVIFFKHLSTSSFHQFYL